MKLLRIAYMLFTASAALGNTYIPKAKMAGETVYARVGKQSTTVAAAFEFEDWATRDEKFVYFPVFAEDQTDPLHVLAQAEIEF